MLAPPSRMPRMVHDRRISCSPPAALLAAIPELISADKPYKPQIDQLTWLVVFAAFLAFFAAYGIGANDVANAYATSVGAKSLTIKQAVVLAAIFEFLGAVTMGSSVAKTIRKGIVHADCFAQNPGLLMWGMTCVILVSKRSRRRCVRVCGAALRRTSKRNSTTRHFFQFAFTLRRIRRRPACGCCLRRGSRCPCRRRTRASAA